MDALIESKADIEPCDIKRRSPLVLASSMDDTFDIVKSLLDAVCLKKQTLVFCFIIMFPSINCIVFIGQHVWNRH